MKLKKGIIYLLLAFIFTASALFSAIDQTYVERILKDNRSYVEFINICVSNFAPEKKDELFTIYQKHFNGEVAFLQGDYKRAFDNVYDSQKDMELLYEYILTSHYLEDSKNMLDGLAPEIIRSKNSLSRQYLSLGYRTGQLQELTMLLEKLHTPSCVHTEFLNIRKELIWQGGLKGTAF